MAAGAALALREADAGAGVRPQLASNPRVQSRGKAIFEIMVCGMDT
jgi:hypothetical protein